MLFPKKGTEVFITMKSGAVYRGIYQWYKDDGRGRILLTDVKIVSRINHDKRLVCPKHGMNRKFWVSKILSIQYGV
jgi:hypothetical protein